MGLLILAVTILGVVAAVGYFALFALASVPPYVTVTLAVAVVIVSMYRVIRSERARAGRPSHR